MVRDRRKRGDRTQIREGPLGELTEREEEVLRLLSGGMSNKEIARALHITHYTVRAHITRILHKLGVEGRTQAAVMWATREQKG